MLAIHTLRLAKIRRDITERYKEYEERNNKKDIGSYMFIRAAFGLNQLVNNKFRVEKLISTLFFLRFKI
jgi:hypothetical protein